MIDGGIIPLWKEKGVYSQRYITQLRALLGLKKVGHAGTLDPDVDGVLPIAFGKGTKVLEYMLDADKVYQGAVTLGWSTTTEDRSGETVEQVKLMEGQLTSQEIDQILASMLGPLTQIPPMYSAVRVKGKRLYEYARQGIEVDRPSRQVEIYSLQRTSDLLYDEESQSLTFSFDVCCSKGTYIRTLAVDIGRALDLPAHMSQLTRVKSAGIIADECVTLEQLKEAKNHGKLEDYIFPLEDFLNSFPFLEINHDLSQRVNHGSQLRQDNFPSLSLDQDSAVVLTHQGQAQAIYHANPDRPGWLKPLKMIRQF